MTATSASIREIRQRAQVGEVFATRGVVLSIERRGFYIQEDAAAPSLPGRALFVFTSDRPDQLVPGDRVRVQGKFDLFRKPESPSDSFAMPQLQATRPGDVQLEGNGALPAPLEVDPAQVDLQFLEDHYGEYVKVAGTVVQPTNDFGDFYLVPGGLAPDAPGRTERGGLREDSPIQPVGAKLPVGFAEKPQVHVGSEISVVGPLGYSVVGEFQVDASQVLAFRKSSLEPGVARLVSSDWAMTVGVLNLENADVTVEDPSKLTDSRLIDDDLLTLKFSRIADKVALLMSGLDPARAPDVVAVQEVQDNDGAEQTTVVDGDKVGLALAAAIRAAGGPEYLYVEVPPELGTSGGMPGGNIRCGFLYRPDRVQLAGKGVIGAGDAAFAGSRLPLVGHFVFRTPDGAGHEVDLINLHKTSRRPKPLPDGTVSDGTQARTEQAESLRAVKTALAREHPERVILELGDFNARRGAPEMAAHATDGFVFLSDEHDYSHYFGGRGTAIDHVVGRIPAGVQAQAQYVHFNADFAEAEGSPRAGDHDGQVVRLDFSAR